MNELTILQAFLTVFPLYWIGVIVGRYMLPKQPAKMAYEDREDDLNEMHAPALGWVKVSDVLELDARNGWIEKEKKS